MTQCVGIHKLRSYRLFNISLFDVIATYFAAVIISYFMKRKMIIKHIFKVFLLLIVIGIITHKVLNIPTMLNHYLGLNDKKSVLATRIC